MLRCGRYPEIIKVRQAKPTRVQHVCRNTAVAIGGQLEAQHGFHAGLCGLDIALKQAVFIGVIDTQMRLGLR